MRLSTTQIKLHNEKIQQYNGYAVQPTSHRLPDGSFSSNLLIERAEGSYQFYTLDYFTSEAQALQHSARWARDWIDARG